MIDATLDRLIADGWLAAGLRLLFIALIYGFLLLVVRATVRDLHVTARTMGHESGMARAALVVLDPAASTLLPGATLPLRAVTVIGRGAASTIVADDPHLSARHAELRFARGQWWLRDLGSSNGTALNGEPVRTVMGVRPGDDIQCGRVRFRLIPLFPVPGEYASA
jgi:hypothetical protein